MFNFLNKIQDLFTKIKFKRTSKQRLKAYNKIHQTPYGVPTRNSGYYQ
jgi:hypothetical protein